MVQMQMRSQSCLYLSASVRLFIFSSSVWSLLALGRQGATYIYYKGSHVFPLRARNTVDAHCPLVTAYMMTSLSDPYSSYCCTRQQRDRDPKGPAVNAEVGEMEK